ncbi:MAG: undecaprenyl/decaprenyl-phosphate alpha-N-acetylglucosaminyl 1-phosphate transferase [Candidatus Aureabacteria bacterium]|nr:undecaprenyl/decaprenyl-phosphate alpha-N-acetylglucosaminyl 1-phosphate transferase [Candidatus Auribacterota bacterium]
MMPLKEMILLAFVSALSSAALTILCKKAALKTGFIDVPSSRKIHTQKVPLLGGLSIFLNIFLITALAIIFIALNARYGFVESLNTYFLPNYSGMVAKLPQLSAIFLGGALIVLAGLYDDKYDLKPAMKIILQLAAATVPIVSGIKISLFLGNNAMSILFTYVWFFLIINAFNLLDNADGLSAGVALIATVVFGVISLTSKELFISSMLFILAGTLMGFLFFNFHKATIFMGDAGSMFLGYILAVFTTLGTYYTSESRTLFPILMPIVVLAVPLYDTFSVIIVRLYKGVSIFAADKNHFSHRLMRLGFSYKAAIIFIYIICLCTGIAAIILPEIDRLFSSLLILLQVFLILFIIGILEYYGAHNGRKKD